jgi:hypothetical protein
MDKLQALLDALEAPAKFDRPFAAKELEELVHLIKTPGYTTDKSQLKERGLEEFKVEQEPKISDEDLAMELMCEELSVTLGKSTETFMLSSPLALTVKKANGAYSKVPHVGSEDFAPARAYMGKRGKIIFVFKPVMVSEYSEMEMEERQARENLVGFKEWLRENFGDMTSKLAEIRSEAAKKAEQTKLADRYETYKDIGFGTW